MLYMTKHKTAGGTGGCHRSFVDDEMRNAQRPYCIHFPSFPLSHFGHLHFAKILKKKFYIIYIIYNIYNIIYNF